MYIGNCIKTNRSETNFKNMLCFPVLFDTKSVISIPNVYFETFPKDLNLCGPDL